MSDRADPGQPAPQPLASLWDRLAARPAATAATLYVALGVAFAVAAYLAIFTVFARYDDEGTLLVTLAAFADGDTLYRDVYSPYGPFYYELFGGFFALTGLDVSTDASRLVVVFVWVLSAILFGLAAQRFSGRLSVGLLSAIVAFSVLYVLTGEPMHPHGLGSLLLGAFLLLLAAAPRRKLLWAGAGAGALLAALTLTKVNVGVYAIAALALAAVLTAEPLQRRRWIRWPVVATFLAMPLAVMARDLGDTSVQALVAAEILAGAALIVAAWPLRPRGGEDGEPLVEWLIAAACGFAAACGAILIAILLAGTTPGDLYDGTITEALRVRDALFNPLQSPEAAVDWGIAALAAAGLTAWLRPDGGGGAALFSGALRAAAGLAIWFAVTQSSPLTLGPAPGNPDSVALALVWVAAVPPPGATEPPYKRFLRVLLPALAVAQLLQVYPVAGSQMWIAALLFVPVGALCLADGLDELRAWSADRGGVALRRFGIVAGVALAAIGAKLAVDELARPIATNAKAYRDGRSLPFPGAGLLHLPPQQAAEYERLVELMRENGCTALIGYPNVNSLYLWSGIDPPRPAAPGTWLTTLVDDRQRRVVRQLRASPRPCAVRSEGLAAAWLNGKPRPEDAPLVRYVFGELSAVEQVGEFEFLIRRGGSRRG